MPASGLPASAPRLFPAMIPARTEVSSVTARVMPVGTLSGGLFASESGYIALKLSHQVLDNGNQASATIEAGTCRSVAVGI